MSSDKDKDEQSSAPLCVQHHMCPFVLFLVRSRNSKCGDDNGLIIKEQHVGLWPRLLLPSHPPPRVEVAGSSKDTYNCLKHCLNYVSYCHNVRGNVGTWPTVYEHYARKTGSANALLWLAMARCHFYFWNDLWPSQFDKPSAQINQQQR